MLKLDLSKLSGFVPEDYLTVREDRLAKAAQIPVMPPPTTTTSYDCSFCLLRTLI